MFKKCSFMILLSPLAHLIVITPKCISKYYLWLQFWGTKVVCFYLPRMFKKNITSRFNFIPMRIMKSFMTSSEFNHHVYCLNAIQYVLKWFHSTFNHSILKWFNSTLKLRSKIAWYYPLAIHIVHGSSFIASLWIPSTFTILCWVFSLCWSFLYLWKSRVQN
jgi:hypothetical protein